MVVYESLTLARKPSSVQRFTAGYGTRAVALRRAVAIVSRLTIGNSITRPFASLCLVGADPGWADDLILLSSPAAGDGYYQTLR